MFGIHVNKQKSIYDTIKNAPTPVMQIFLWSPMKYDEKLITNLEIPKIKKLDKKVYVHSNYVSPLLSKNPRILKKQLEECDKIGAAGFVIHIYYQDPKLVASSLAKISNYDTMIYLEPHVTKHQGKYTDLANIAKLWSCIKTKNIGLCLDTAHIWTTGFDISNPVIMKKYLLKAYKICPNLLIHLNDSKQDLGDASKDRHAEIGHKIWKHSRKSLDLLFRFCKVKKIDIIYEYAENWESLANTYR